MADTPRVVVDSSVAVKWLLEDAESDVAAALRLLDDHIARRVVLTAPSSMLAEVLNALRSRGVSPDNLSAAASILLRLHIELVAVESLLMEAAAIAPRCGLTVYDALLAALATELHCELVTADERLATSGACTIWLLSDMGTIQTEEA